MATAVLEVQDVIFEQAFASIRRNGVRSRYDNFVGGRFVVNSGASDLAISLSEALNRALGPILAWAPKNGPPMMVHVRPHHSANLTKDFDQNGIHLVFDEGFIMYFVEPAVLAGYPAKLQQDLIEISAWIIATTPAPEAAGSMPRTQTPDNAGW